MDTPRDDLTQEIVNVLKEKLPSAQLEAAYQMIKDTKALKDALAAKERMIRELEVELQEQKGLVKIYKEQNSSVVNEKLHLSEERAALRRATIDLELRSQEIIKQIIADGMITDLEKREKAIKDRTAELDAMQARLDERENMALLRDAQAQEHIAQENAKFCKDVALGLVRNTEYRKDMFTTSVVPIHPTGPNQYPTASNGPTGTAVHSHTDSVTERPT